jgi:uncharacterized membrane protein YgcG
MRNALRSPSLLVALTVLAASPATAQPYPDEPGDGIADLAGVLTPADADSVRAVLGRMRTGPGVEVAVLTVRNVAAYRAASGEAFATGVYNHWRLGYGQRNDGVLVLLSLDDRFTRIELGDGVPADQDARMRAIVDGVMVPRFRQGDLSGGLRDGVLAIATAFNTPPPASATPPTSAPPAPRTEPVVWPEPRTDDAFDSELKLSERALLLILLVGALLAGVGMRIYLRTRKAVCGRCGDGMLRLSEEADDVYLDSGRRLEEVLGSMNYVVWHCARCGNHAVARDPRLSTRDRCKECGYRTVGVRRSVVQQPTYDSSGSEQVETKCAHCGWTDVDVIHLPRKQRPRPSTGKKESLLETFLTGGGSSGGGGGGGGSSSGRGSSGRW